MIGDGGAVMDQVGIFLGDAPVFSSNPYLTRSVLQSQM